MILDKLRTGIRKSPLLAGAAIYTLGIGVRRCDTNLQEDTCDERMSAMVDQLTHTYDGQIADCLTQRDAAQLETNTCLHELLDSRIDEMDSLASTSEALTGQAECLTMLGAAQSQADLAQLEVRLAELELTACEDDLTLRLEEQATCQDKLVSSLRGQKDCLARIVTQKTVFDEETQRQSEVNSCVVTQESFDTLREGQKRRLTRWLETQ